MTSAIFRGSGLACLAVLAACLPACGPAPSKATDEQQGTDLAERSGRVDRVDRVDRVEAPPRTPLPTPTPVPAIATNPGSDGSQVALNRVTVAGDIMTVQLSVTGNGGGLSFKIADVSAVDDASAKRMAVLRDNDGRWMAAPVDRSGNMSVFSLNARPDVIWMKFPAPPATSRTVSINIPDVAPFDAVPVQR